MLKLKNEKLNSAHYYTMFTRVMWYLELEMKSILKTGVSILLGLAAGAVQAQFNVNTVPAPKPTAAQSMGANFKVTWAQRIYASYPDLVHKGKLPSPLYAVAIVETTVTDGLVKDVKVIREPAFAKETMPWMVTLINSIGAFPGIRGQVTYREIWLVTQDGKFQLDSITEGQDSRN